jgi:L-2-hydroxyglutarate oxidase LhgO
MDQVEAIVIGAGVIGLACARALARSGREVLILERHAVFGSEISARNSEVIHAGIYYPAGSRKARYCVAGREQLYGYCDGHGVDHRRCGKLIVATAPGQLGRLTEIKARGEANGVDDLRLIEGDEARALEPSLSCIAALLSPSTGIVDSHGLMLSLLGDAERSGATLAVRSPFVSAACDRDGFSVVTGEDRGLTLRCRILVNAAGLSAPAVASRIDGLPQDSVPTAYLAKGNYFSLNRRSPFSHLIYPIPEPGGLGVHLTLDLAGQARFGPDVEWVSGEDYRVDERRGERFYGAIRQYWPDLADGELQPAYAGIRPKIRGPGEADADFEIQGPAVHGVPGLVNLFGIESPGLTSCLAIADVVAGLATEAAGPGLP